MEVRMSMYFSVGFLLWSYGSYEFLCVVVNDCFRYSIALDECLKRWSRLTFAFSGVEEDKAGVVIQVDGEDIC